MLEEKNKESINDFVEYSKKVREDIEKTRKELLGAFVIGQDENSFVEITLGIGGYAVHKVEIKPEVMGKSKETLELCIASAFKDAVKKAEDVIKQKIKNPLKPY